MGRSISQGIEMQNSFKKIIETSTWDILPLQMENHHSNLPNGNFGATFFEKMMIIRAPWKASFPFRCNFMYIGRSKRFLTFRLMMFCNLRRCSAPTLQSWNQVNISQEKKTQSLTKKSNAPRLHRGLYITVTSISSRGCEYGTPESAWYKLLAPYLTHQNDLKALRSGGTIALFQA